MKKQRLVGSLILLLLAQYPFLFCAYNLHYYIVESSSPVWQPGQMIQGLIQENQIQLIFLLLECLLLILLVYILVNSKTLEYDAGLQEIIPGIKTPKPSDKNLQGSGRWLLKKKYKKAFRETKIIRKDPVIQWLMQRGYDDLKGDFHQKIFEVYGGDTVLPSDTGGLVVGQTKNHKKLYSVVEDTHSYVIGATRSGKTLYEVLISICVTALAGESIVVSDVKGELFIYSHIYLKRLGYEVIDLDFNNPAVSKRYNFMRPINERLEANDIVEAKRATNELVESLTTRNNHSEPIWEEGEKSILACCIMAVAYDNRNNPEQQNLTNVYHFIAKMCAPVEGCSSIPLQEYLDARPDDHPAKSLAGISDVAHFRTRSSFYAAALATLRLFEDYAVADMTRVTDFELFDTKRKRAIFIILPDEKPAYYKVASLFVQQYYQALVSQSKKHGNRLERRVHFILDEVGNFAAIPDFAHILTVSGGRGIRFHLFVQSSKQLDEKYNQNVSSIIRSNCETWVYLHSDDDETVKEICDRLGTYTTKSPNLSAPLEGTHGGSASYSYISHPLLGINDIRRIHRPYQIVMSRHDPAIMYQPHFSTTIFNQMLGMGDKEHNIKLNMWRNKRRQEDARDIKAPILWNIWDVYIENMKLKAKIAAEQKSAAMGQQILNKQITH